MASLWLSHATDPRHATPATMTMAVWMMVAVGVMVRVRVEVPLEGLVSAPLVPAVLSRPLY